MSLPATSRTVDGLLQRGLLERREDEHDRRIKRVRLTDEGRDVVDRIDTARLAGPRGLRRHALPDEQRAALLAAAARPRTRRTHA